MRVFEHVSNAPDGESRTFLVLVYDHHHPNPFQDAVLIEAFVNELGEACLVATKTPGLTEVSPAEWVPSSRFSSGFAVFSTLQH